MVLVQLLVVDPAKRLRLKDALQHPWITTTPPPPPQTTTTTQQQQQPE